MSLVPYVDLRADPLVRAKTYPYANPGQCFLWTEQGYAVLGDGAACPDLAGRVPIVGCGSNQSPHQLALKFGGRGLGSIPVLCGSLHDFDSVFAAQFNSYGGVPATLAPSAGTRTRLFVTWLLPDQERRMHETEALGVEYDLVHLDGVRLEMDRGPSLESVFTYVARGGAFLENGHPVALHDVPAKDRRFATMTETQILELARVRLDPARTLDDFISLGIGNTAIKVERSRHLAATSRPFAYASATVVNP